MSDNRTIAATLTMALYSQRPRGSIKNVSGTSDLQFVFKDYQQFLEMLQAKDKAFEVPPAK